jgi:hypothetical protein
MIYTLFEFKNLRERFNTWTALGEYLSSDEGGAFGVRETAGYALIYYRKGITNMTLTHSKWFRSVVWNIQTNMPVAVSTPKAVEEGAEGGNVFEWGAEQFTGKTVQNFLEGVTLTIFRGADGQTQVSSRTRLGAGRGFYSKVSFREMLDDAVKARGFGTVDELLAAQNGSNFLTVLLQHPSHRVVQVVAEPRLYILQTGMVAADGSVTVREMYESQLEEPAGGETVAAWVEHLVTERGWGWQGITVHDGAGQRWRIRSSLYHMVRSMRGATSRADERFFGLRATGMVKTYLQYYPEDSDLYWQYEKWVRGVTRQLYKYYVDVHKAHSAILNDIDTRWHTHIGGLHRVYMTVLKPAGKSVRLTDVMEYVNTLPTPRMLFLMNIDKRVAAVAAVAAVAT